MMNPELAYNALMAAANPERDDEFRYSFAVTHFMDHFTCARNELRGGCLPRGETEYNKRVKAKSSSHSVFEEKGPQPLLKWCWDNDPLFRNDIINFFYHGPAGDRIDNTYNLTNYTDNKTYYIHAVDGKWQLFFSRVGLTAKGFKLVLIKDKKDSKNLILQTIFPV
jgi:hypothetical protein